MKRIGGERRKKRALFSKTPKTKGKVSIRKYLAEFQTGDKVALTVEPAIQTGMYHPRFAGKTGTIKSKKGECYEVSIIDITKAKTLLVHPVHLKRV
ncbi:50S ribosomal protein L21e [Candidatus Woesearchaeota archaeon]|nr:50S ribosomal protein L21e [Candidatus Woesearchaeota archaeon]MCF8013638.1 50S ribosomal protein L21e [Candidatus Woesearchaeota archaeon]